MRKCVVCMNSHYLRDSQMFDPSDLSDEEFENVDVHDEMMDGHWHDIEPSAFIGIFEAINEDMACQIAGKKRRYDSRTLFAIEIQA